MSTDGDMLSKKQIRETMAKMQAIIEESTSGLVNLGAIDSEKFRECLQPPRVQKLNPRRKGEKMDTEKQTHPGIPNDVFRPRASSRRLQKTRVPRNGRCPCGSGMKSKYCCGKGK